MARRDFSVFIVGFVSVEPPSIDVTKSNGCAVRDLSIRTRQLPETTVL